MANPGIGYQDGGTGSFGFQMTSDGQVKLGNTADDVIQVTGTMAIKGNLEIDEMGGLVVAQTVLIPAVAGVYEIPDSFGVVSGSDGAAKISFTAPTNGKIEILWHAHIGDVDNDWSYMYAGLSDSLTYNSLGSQYEVFFGQYDESDDITHNNRWYITGLTPGTTYTYYVGMEKSRPQDTLHVYWGGTDGTPGAAEPEDRNYPPMMLKAITVPTTVGDGT